MGSTRSIVDKICEKLKAIVEGVSGIKVVYEGSRDVIAKYPAVCISIVRHRTEKIATGKEQITCEVELLVLDVDMENGEKIVRQKTCDIVDALKANSDFNGSVLDNGYTDGYNTDVGRGITAAGEMPYVGVIAFTCYQRANI